MISYGGYVGAGTIGTIGYNSGLAVVANLGAPQRIKVDGVLTHIRIRLGTGYTEALHGPVTIRIHRDTGASLDASHVVSGLSSQIAEGIDLADNTLYALDTPIRVSAGDAYSIEWTGDTSHRLGCYASITGSVMGYQNTAKVDGASWTTTTAAVAIELFGTEPEYIIAGDSTAAGHTGGVGTGWASSGTDNVAFYSTNYRNTACNMAALIRTLTNTNYAAGSELIDVCYNCGVGSSKAANWVATHWAANITPVASAGAQVIFRIGINDVVGNVALESFLGSLDSLLALAVADGVTFNISTISHVPSAFTADDETEVSRDAEWWNARIDTWNTGIIDWAYDNDVKVFDHRTLPGTNTVSASDVHPNQAGYGLIGLCYAAGLRLPVEYGKELGEAVQLVTDKAAVTAAVNAGITSSTEILTIPLNLTNLTAANVLDDVVIGGVTGTAPDLSDILTAIEDLGSPLQSLGTNAPAGWLNAAAIAASALNGKGDWASSSVWTAAVAGYITALRNGLVSGGSIATGATTTTFSLKTVDYPYPPSKGHSFRITSGTQAGKYGTIVSVSGNVYTIKAVVDLTGAPAENDTIIFAANQAFLPDGAIGDSTMTTEAKDDLKEDFQDGLAKTMELPDVDEEGVIVLPTDTPDWELGDDAETTAAAVWASTTRTLTGSQLSLGPTASRSPSEGSYTFYAGDSRPLYRRIIVDGDDLTQAGVTSITYTIYEQDEDKTLSSIEGHEAVALTVADVIWDTIQSDGAASNWNFKHWPDNTTNEPYPDAATQYLVQYRIVLATGRKIIESVLVRTKE